MNKILLASNNRHKAAEFVAIMKLAAANDFELVLPGEVFSEVIDVPETGTTLEENALLKASAFYKAAQLPSIADDTGLFIDALGGAPGIDAAIFAGEHGNDSLNRQKVLRLLEGVPPGRRTAYFRTVICYYDASGAFYADGILRGAIAMEERGAAGFGYDSIFVPVGSPITFAGMDVSDKNRISHRAQAIRNFLVKYKEMSIG